MCWRCQRPKGGQASGSKPISTRNVSLVCPGLVARQRKKRFDVFGPSCLYLQKPTLLRGAMVFYDRHQGLKLLALVSPIRRPKFCGRVRAKRWRTV